MAERDEDGAVRGYLDWIFAAAADIDVLAAHVRIEGIGRRGTKEVWYLLPIAAIEGKKNLRFFPGLRGRDPRWEGYREGWEWLRG